eukprot:6467028-Prymnesium_polylepis.1
MYKRAWVEEWYGKELGVMDVLTGLGYEPNWGSYAAKVKAAVAKVTPMPSKAQVNKVGPAAPVKPAKTSFDCVIAGGGAC